MPTEKSILILEQLRRELSEIPCHPWEEVSHWIDKANVVFSKQWKHVLDDWNKVIAEPVWPSKQPRFFPPIPPHSNPDIEVARIAKRKILNLLDGLILLGHDDHDPQSSQPGTTSILPSGLEEERSVVIHDGDNKLNERDSSPATGQLNMDVLLCWSKERSKLVARELHDWLPKVIPALKPWMSELDIDKGSDWFSELHHFLGEAKAIIVCVTPENVRSPWICYESGQVAARTNSKLICPYLLDEQPSILADGPLGRMQCTQAQKEDTFRLLRTLNKSLGDRAIDDAALGTAFENEWPSLSGTLKRIRDIEVQQGPPVSFIKSDVDELAGGNLSSEARTMVLELESDPHGQILRINTRGGQHFQTNGKDLNANGDARSSARWNEALRDLVRLGILEAKGVKGEVFGITAKGYRLCDLLRQSK